MFRRIEPTVVQTRAAFFASSFPSRHVDQILIGVKIFEEIHLLGAVIAGKDRVAASHAGNQVLRSQTAQRSIVGLFRGFEVAIEPAGGDTAMAETCAAPYCPGR